MKIRGFELVSSFTDENLLPKRETAHAAGYDLKVAVRTVARRDCLGSDRG
ncbi:deoxyuridine 5'-triphosphate nucleotidohydrolase [Streptococcus pneumoniae]|nr:deoxyuridine 5'-triphosphate nucleotidohydrolase [Streptococcus pneumoniae]